MIVAFDENSKSQADIGRQTIIVTLIGTNDNGITELFFGVGSVNVIIGGVLATVKQLIFVIFMFPFESSNTTTVQLWCCC